MKKKLAVGLTFGIMLAGLSGEAGATLTTIGSATYGGNGYNLIWDDDNNGNSVVWLDYSNTQADWNTQVAWAAGLNGSGVLAYTLNAGYSVDWGANDWRLPSTVDGAYQYGFDGTTTGGYNITSSEMGHLFYTELGNKGALDTNGTLQSDYGLTSVGDFDHLMPYWYWSGTEYAAIANRAWEFDMNSGYQYHYPNSSEYHVGCGLAVRSGQVRYSDPNGAAPVPEPATMLLLGTGLAGLAGGRLRQRRGRIG